MLRVLLTFVVTVTMCSMTQAAERESVVDIGSRLELFLDDWLIAKMENVSLRVHPPQWRDIAMRFDSLWEGGYSSVGTVIKDGDVYRMWYRGQPTLGRPVSTHYAESVDGIHWTKPDLGLVKRQSPKLPPTKNNIVRRDVYSYNFTPFLDRNPNCKTQERYKATANIVPWMTTGLPDKERLALAANNATVMFSSPDGIRWTMMETEKMRGVDAQTPLFWDSNCGEYRMYRSHYHIQTMTSKDFRNWTEWVPVSYDDKHPELKYYSCAVMPYIRAPHMLICLASRMGLGPFLDRTSPFAKMGGKIAKIGSHDGVLMSSRDGLHFHRHMEAFVRPGPDIHNWTGHSMFPFIGVVPTGPQLPDGTHTELSFYFTQHYSLPSAHVARFAIRLDGFASVNAKFNGGKFTTRPFTFKGSKLELNFSTAAAGSMRIEVQDKAGKPLPGYTLDECLDIYGDDLIRQVSWKGGSDVSKLAGKPIRLRFVMKDADLYSIRFR